MPRPNPIRTWLQLLRAPNLLTVPGDPVAGYLLASFGLVEDHLFFAIGASFCFYAGGLLLNDLADLTEDRRERPNRPLPSGAASVPVVAAVLAMLFAAGLWLCWQIDPVTFATGGALLVAIVAYNCGSKRIPVVGAVNMGLCRGLSMMLGATAVPHGDLTWRLIGAGRLDHLGVAVCTVIVYITSVTHLARFETKSKAPRSAVWIPPIALFLGCAAFLGKLDPLGRWRKLIADYNYVTLASFLVVLTSTLLFLVGLASCHKAAKSLDDIAPVPLPPQIGRMIRILLLLQAGFCAATFLPVVQDYTPLQFTAALVLMWPISRLLGRWFYAS